MNGRSLIANSSIKFSQKINVTTIKDKMMLVVIYVVQFSTMTDYIRLVDSPVASEAEQNMIFTLLKLI